MHVVHVVHIVHVVHVVYGFTTIVQDFVAKILLIIMFSLMFYI